MLEQMLDLDRGVVAQAGKLGVERLDDPQRVLDAVEEVWVAEGDVLGAQHDELADVFEDDVLGVDSEAAAIDRGEWAVEAAVGAAAAGLDVPGELLAQAIVEAGVAVERREEVAAGE